MKAMSQGEIRKAIITPAITLILVSTLLKHITSELCGAKRVSAQRPAQATCYGMVPENAMQLKDFRLAKRAA